MTEKRLLYKNVSTKYTIRYIEGKISVAPDDFNEIKTNDLPEEFDIVILESYHLFPINILKNKRIKEIHLACHIAKSDENFEILYEIEKEKGVVSFFSWTPYYQLWYNQEKRLKLIQNILK